ncbi:MAG: fused MFS/spermidine synthase, partial [Planctomycetota bacterium]|nr:fused MFS/spermidine synthase [Planctomycetota bacterium]
MAENLPARAEPGWRYTPHLIVFFSSAFIMVLELVAGRLIARHLGSSLYTWTSIIGVILAGISLGNYLGGRLADCWRPEAMLGVLFLLASVSAFLVLPLNYLFATYDLVDEVGGWLAQTFWRVKDWEASWPTKTFCAVFGIFFLPAFILGTISPVAAKIALERGSAIGQTIGSVYAWGAVGSILGTFLTGFWLVAALGAQGVAMFVVAGLAIMAVCAARRWWRAAASAWAVLALFLFTLSQLPAQKLRAPLADIPERHAQIYRRFLKIFAPASASDADFAKDSNYQYVYVYQNQSKKDPERQIKILRLDYLIHSYVDPDDPEHLEYGYEGIYREVVERFFGDRAALSAFFLGGGGYSFPRWLRARWPEVAIDVAEIDPVVVEAN